MEILQQFQCAEKNYLQKQDIPLPDTKIQQESKKFHLHWVVYFINLIMMVSIPSLTVYVIFGDSKRLDIKAALGFVSIAICILGMTATIIKLKVRLKDLIKTLIILDSIVIYLGINAIAFIAMMIFLDTNKWEMKVLQVAYCFTIVTKTLNIRVLLLYRKWKTWQVVVFKIGLCFMAVIYFSIGVYCFYTNYSFTYNILKIYDQQCRYFVVLYVFASFDFSCRLVKTMSNFDYTQNFKYEYIIKNVDRSRIQKCKQIKKSMKFIPLLKQQQAQAKSIHLIPVSKVRPQCDLIEKSFINKEGFKNIEQKDKKLLS